MKLFHFADPGEAGYDFVVLADSVAEARKLALAEAENVIAEEQLPSVRLHLSRRSPHRFDRAVALSIFTECDPIQSRISLQRLHELEDAEAQLKALRAPVAENEWQPMSTAPKHRSAIDLWLSSKDGVEQWRETDCWWNPERKLWCSLRGQWSHSDARGWRTPPQPPAKEGN